MTPLHLAARDGLYSVTVLLLAFGAKAHKAAAGTDGNRSADESLKRRFGGYVNENPLAVGMEASSSSDPASKSPPYMPSPSKGAYSRALRTPLQWAVCTGCLEVTVLLINDGAHLFPRFPPHDMYSGKTCLHVATILGYVEIVETLLRAGADIDAKDDTGKKAYQLCEDSGHPRCDEVSRVLLSYASTRVVSSGGKLESRSSKLMLVLGAALGYIDSGTDIAAIYVMFQHTSEVYRHSNRPWAILCIVSLCLPHIAHAMLQMGRGMMLSSVRSLLFLELAYATVESLLTNTRNSTYMTMKYLTIAFQAIPQSMVQVTVLLVRWQHWGGRSETTVVNTVNPGVVHAGAVGGAAGSAGHADPWMSAWMANMNATAVASASPLTQERITTVVAYPPLHVLVLAFSIFTSLVTAMHTAVLLASTNEDSAWKGKLMKNWTTLLLSCTFFFCDGYVHISSFASFATVYRQFVFLPLALMIGTTMTVDTHLSLTHTSFYTAPRCPEKKDREDSHTRTYVDLFVIGRCRYNSICARLFNTPSILSSCACMHRISVHLFPAIICILLTRAFGQSRPAFLRALFVSPLLSFVDFPLLPGPRTGLKDYWILYRVLMLSTVLNFIMMTCSVAAAVHSRSRPWSTYPYVNGTVFQNAGVWVMPLITGIMYSIKVVALKRLLGREEMMQSSQDDVEKLKSVTYRRSYLFNSPDEFSAKGGELVMTKNPLSDSRLSALGGFGSADDL